MIASVVAGTVLADSGNGPSAGLGLIVFLVLLVACIFLFRSMSGRIKRLPASFDAPPAEETTPVSTPDADDSP